MIRLKRTAQLDGTIMIATVGEPIRVKLQERVMYSSSDERTYWEWRDVEIVDSDADDLEEQDKYGD